MMIVVLMIDDRYLASLMSKEYYCGRRLGGLCNLKVAVDVFKLLFIFDK
jgi:hypothetical protein